MKKTIISILVGIFFDHLNEIIISTMRAVSPGIRNVKWFFRNNLTVDGFCHTRNPCTMNGILGTGRNCDLPTEPHHI